MRALFQYLQRASEIFLICIRHLLEIAYHRLSGRKGIPGPDRLRQMLEELSGSFLKFGQILSLQVDALPREYCDALLNLLDRVPPFAKEHVRRIFLEEWSQPPELLFREFDYVPIASASIGQVHRATLKDSTRVAVKVQRPGIREVFFRDAFLLRVCLRIIFFFKIRSLYFMRDPIREFNDWLQDELDYQREASYGEVLGRNAQQTPTEAVPRIHWNLTCQRVLTMDFLDGYSVMEYLRLRDCGDESKLAELKKLNFNPSQFVSNVISNFLSDAFRFGFFHADLHPANLLIMRDNVIGYVDFGIVGSMTPEARRKQIQLSLAYVRGKTEEICSAFLNVCTFAEGVDLPGFRNALEGRCQLWYREPAIGGVPHLDRSLTIAMFDLLSLCRNYGMLVDREMIKYIRSLMLVDGLVSRLAPGLDLAPQIRKLCEDYLAREAQAKMFSEGAMLTLLADISGWLHAGPSRMLYTLDLMERRQLRLQVRAERGDDKNDGLRIKLLFVTAVWFLLVLLGLWGRQQAPLSAGLSSSGYFLIGFWGVWTIWLADLLRRLAKQ